MTRGLQYFLQYVSRYGCNTYLDAMLVYNKEVKTEKQTESLTISYYTYHRVRDLLKCLTFQYRGRFIFNLYSGGDVYEDYMGRCIKEIYSQFN